MNLVTSYLEAIIKEKKLSKWVWRVVVCGPFEYVGVFSRRTILRSCPHGPTLLIFPLLSSFTVPS